jgi:hypothetical protein
VHTVLTKPTCCSSSPPYTVHEGRLLIPSVDIQIAVFAITAFSYSKLFRGTIIDIAPKLSYIPVASCYNERKLLLLSIR